MRFYDFVEYERLVAPARETGVRAYLLVLLAGEAGLRLGEMVALEWRDIDFTKGQVCVQRSAGRPDRVAQRRELVQLEQVRWRRERDSNPR